MISYSNMVLSRNPTNYWRLNEGVGTFTAIDQMGANNGAYANPFEPVKHVLGPTVVNDDLYGITCRGLVNMGQNIGWWTEPFLIEFWYKMIVNNSNVLRIYSVGTATLSFEVYHDNVGRLHSKGYSSGATLECTDPYEDPGGDWHNCLVVFHSNAMVLYRDGFFVCGDVDALWTGMHYQADSYLYFPDETNNSTQVKSYDEIAIYSSDWYLQNSYHDWWNHLNDRNLLPVV